MPDQLNQSLFAQIKPFSGGVLRIQLLGPSIGQREVPIITDLVGPQIEEMGPTLKHLVIDMSHITFMNSMGLGMCIDFRNRANKLGAKAIMLGLNQQMLELFKMVKVDRLFTIVKDDVALEQVIRK